MRNYISDPGYEIRTVDPLRSEDVRELMELGFTFHDRVLDLEIDLKSYREPAAEAQLSGLDIEFVRSQEYDSDMYELAHSVFTNDRRFHYDVVFDQTQANRRMDSYIDSYRAGGASVFKALHGGELLGFAIADETADPRGRFFENVLGVTKPGIKGKMIASALYTGMLRSEAGSFGRYLGRVSSSNAASINLHFQLGGRVTGISDEFIRKLT